MLYTGTHKRRPDRKETPEKMQNSVRVTLLNRIAKSEVVWRKKTRILHGENAKLHFAHTETVKQQQRTSTA